MKTKIVIAALTSALITNVASAEAKSTGLKIGGDIQAGYVSDDFFRGQASGGESLQATVGFNTNVGSAPMPVPNLILEHFQNRLACLCVYFAHGLAIHIGR